MSEAKHTSREWLLDGLTIYALQHAGWRGGVEVFCNRFSATVHGDKGIPLEELIANAQLMKASPDMLLALHPVAQEIIDHLPTPSEESYNPEYHVEITLSVAECRAILAAVAKARGE